MATVQTNYQSLRPNPFSQNPNSNNANNNNQDEENFDDSEDEPANVMIHVVPETSRSRWNHIEDLDSFFSRIYKFHQSHGFRVMMVQEFLELGQFIFAVYFLTYAINCIKYPVLFRDDPISKNITTKLTIKDVTYTNVQCVANFGGWTWLMIILSVLFWLFRVIRVFLHFIQNLDVKSFYNVALKIDDSELDNFTWHEVQKRIRDVQTEQQMCIHKEQLSELDIYMRILRFKNYMVAMMNKSLLPNKVRLPLLGEFPCLSKGLIYNIELILFYGPFSPFENNWHLKEEFKRAQQRTELANNLSKQILWVAVANLILSPFVFLFSLMYFFFNYATLIRKEPNILGMRCWSQYGKLYLRHFNELDHELNARLNRAYRPADRYLNSFSSPLLTVIAQNIMFVFGGIAAFLMCLTAYDEDVIQVEHVLTILSVFTVIAFMAKSLIPEENMVWCPEQLLMNVLAHAHYLPAHWRGFAHTTKVRDQFEDFFQLKAMYLLNELFSPFITPFVLLFSLRPRSQEIVDFFRNFTVSVIGVGDVCSFAQMDVRKHGNPDWQITSSGGKEEFSPTVETNQYTQGENGKTELSLVHFTMTNPTWKMPLEAKQFVKGIRKHAINDLNKGRNNLGGFVNNTAMGQSLLSVGSLGDEYSSIVQSVLQINNLSTSFYQPQTYAPSTYNQTQPTVQQEDPAPSGHTFDFERILQQNLTDGSMTTPLRSQFLSNIVENEDSDDDRQETGARSNLSKSVRGNLCKQEGPIEGSRRGLLHSLMPQNDTVFSPEFTTADMCLSTLYIHELHHKQIRRRGIRLEESQRHLWQRPHQQPSASAVEKTPLLGGKKS